MVEIKRYKSSIRIRRYFLSSGDCDYDVTVVSIHEDEWLNKEICEHLTGAKHLKVFDYSQVPEGQGIITVFCYSNNDKYIKFILETFWDRNEVNSKYLYSSIL